MVKTVPLFLKFDLAKKTLQHLTEFFLIASREGAIRTSILADTAGIWKEGGTSLTLITESLANWIAIKVPGLEGTEIWLLPDTSQTRVETKTGFSEKSVPIHTFSAALLDGQYLKDPVRPGVELQITFKVGPTPDALTGSFVSPINAKDFTQPNPALISKLKNQGSLLFC